MGAWWGPGGPGDAMKGLKLGPAAGVGTLLIGLTWGQGRSRPQLNLRTGKKSCPSARVPCWDSGHWEGSSGALQESCRTHQACKFGRVTNPGPKMSTLGESTHWLLELHRTTARNLSHSTLSDLFIPKSPMWKRLKRICPTNLNQRFWLNQNYIESLNYFIYMFNFTAKLNLSQFKFLRVWVFNILYCQTLKFSSSLFIMSRKTHKTWNSIITIVITIP